MEKKAASSNMNFSLDYVEELATEEEMLSFADSTPFIEESMQIPHHFYEKAVNDLSIFVENNAPSLPQNDSKSFIISDENYTIIEKIRADAWIDVPIVAKKEEELPPVVLDKEEQLAVVEQETENTVIVLPEIQENPISEMSKKESTEWAEILEDVAMEEPVSESEWIAQVEEFPITTEEQIVSETEISIQAEEIFYPATPQYSNENTNNELQIKATTRSVRKGKYLLNIVVKKEEEALFDSSINIQTPQNQVIESKFEDIISQFLMNEPKISKVKMRSNPREIAPISDIEKEEEMEIVTESMAKIYLSQGNKNAAIKIYEKLCLLFPEKNTYFATQISSIKDNKI